MATNDLLIVKAKITMKNTEEGGGGLVLSQAIDQITFLNYHPINQISMLTLGIFSLVTRNSLSQANPRL